jgi:hypothetical protein
MLPGDFLNRGDRFKLALEPIPGVIHLPEPPEFRRKATLLRRIALFSGLVGAMMLSRAVKKSDPTLSDELLSSARNILKLKR